jgi:hypothetical protein
LEILKETYENKFGNISTKMMFGAVPYRDGEMMAVQVDNKGLLQLGWKPITGVTQGVEKLVEESS